MSGHTEYLVIFEEGEHSVGAYIPDLPGCMAVGENRAQVKQLIREAIEESVPRPHSFVEVIAV
jgi:predicted RNase H-like HicB family nuclease